ncbi:MAG: hypothetical protein AB7F86_05370 [Bdellovibrionales bacterium]
MRLTLTVLMGLAVHLTAQAQNAWLQLNQGYSPESRLELEKSFSFFESCEAMPGKVVGRDSVTSRVRAISIEIYRPREGARGKRVLIVPPWGGVSAMDRDYARQFCGRGIEAWVITEWEPGVKDYQLSLDLRSHDWAARRAVTAVRQVVGQMRGPVGILGTSAGAIIASVAIAIEPRLRAGVLIAGGAGMDEIVASSDAEVMVALRNARERQYGWSHSQYRAYLKQYIQLDVRDFAQGFRGKRIGTIIATSDNTVPLRNQLLLERISGAKRLATYDYTHTWAIVMSYVWTSPKVVQFFERNL